MDSHLLIVLGFGFVATILGGLLVYFYFFAPSRSDIRGLMGSQGGARGGLGGARSASDKAAWEDSSEREFQKVKDKRGRGKKKQKVSLEEKLFHAGIFSDKDKREFNRLRVIAPILLVIATTFIGSSLGGTIMVVSAVIGLLIGIQLPKSILDRKILRRSDDIMFYLPLVIEQIAIGVSSSLDIGPCVQRVVSMADERDSHNVVTELLRVVVFLAKSGLSLEDALNDIGRKAGHTELKHAFMSLSQVAKHGGEITRQLQELADAVSNQRETKIDAKIKKLELEATVPVALVFAGFLVILLIGFGLQVLKAFK